MSKAIKQYDNLLAPTRCSRESENTCLLVTEKGSMKDEEDNEQSTSASAVEGIMEDNEQSASAPAMEGS